MLTGFLGACVLFAQKHPDTVFVVPCISPAIERFVIDAAAGYPNLALITYLGDARRALTASHGTIVKSGTGTLEAMLLRRPMVVSYRLGEMSYQLLRLLVKTPYVALPNILAGRMLVPELLQHAATPEALANGLAEQLARSREDADYFDEFTRLHKALRLDADSRSAAAVLALVEQHGSFSR